MAQKQVKPRERQNTSSYRISRIIYLVKDDFQVKLNYTNGIQSVETGVILSSW
jgi:hypothetical protein